MDHGVRFLLFILYLSTELIISMCHIMFYNKNHAHTTHSVSPHLGFLPRRMLTMYILEVALREMRDFIQDWNYSPWSGCWINTMP